MNTAAFTTFLKGSKTYFYSSIFFPEPLRSNVFSLYGFVRKADDFVDEVPQQKDEFYAFVSGYREALAGRPCGDVIIDSFVDLVNREHFDTAWIDAFLRSMELDLTKSTYATIDETLEYIYGSAEVIGLMMARIMGLDPASYEYARMQGRSMQYINFIRDIDEDNGLGRRYLPLEGTGLPDLREETAMAHREAFESLIRREIDRYRGWQSEAEKGYPFIPKRYLIPIKTASDMYRWTAEQVYRDPLIVYKRKMKPGVPRIVGTIARNTVSIPRRRHGE